MTPCQPSPGDDPRPTSLPVGDSAGLKVQAMMKLPPALQLRDYFVIATDPLADWRCVQMTVRAIARDEARIAARRELATVKCDHWTIGIVVEADADQRLDANGYLP